MGAPSPDQDIAAIRRNYQRASLRSVDLDADPVEQFRRWLQQALAADLQESTAMVLSTFDGKRPSSRTVLLKAFDKRGFVFFTNYGSRKAQEISAHPNVSLQVTRYEHERGR